MNKVRLVCTAAFGNEMSISERLSNGGRMILVLMAFVFAVIFTIFVSQSIISFVINKAQSRTQVGNKQNPRTNIKTSSNQKSENIVTANNEISQSPAQGTSENGVDEVTVAVITAALTAYLEANSEDGKVLPFRVVSFKRKNSGKPWNS